MDDMMHMDVVLLQMPVTWLHPSLALGLLKADLNRAGVQNEVVYASHHYVELLGADLYRKTELFMEMFPGGWEMLFAPFTDFKPSVDAREMILRLARHGQETSSGDQAVIRMAEERAGWLLARWDELSALTDAFLSREAELILSKTPRIAGFSILTEQRNASFALMKRLKERDPGIITILGGGCCQQEAGPAFLRGVPSLDYCFSGEGDDSLGDGCALLLEGKTKELKARHPEFLSRGDPPVNRVFQDVNACLLPDYTEYFEQFRKDAFLSERQALLVAEGSRGCWWGEKGRCRFCGLHSCAEALHYRKKTPERFFEETAALAETYHVNQFVLADTNLDMELIRSLPETAPRERSRLTFFAECKSNLSADQLKRLKNNGFKTLQPGIESLSDEVLDLMHKGARTIQQLAFLKFARQFEIKSFWNLMYGLPGEQEAWYKEMFGLMEHLHFLQPPTGVTKMLLVRNSVFWEDPKAYGLGNIRPRLNESAFDPDEEFTRATCGVFVSEDLKYLPGIRERVWEAVSSWRKDYERGAKLLLISLPEKAVIRDLRVPQSKRIYHLTGLKRKLYDMVYEVAAEKDVFRKLQGEDSFSPQEIEEALSFFTERFLMYRKDGRLLSLAIPEEEKHS